jgi:polyphosphate kinase 2
MGKAEKKEKGTGEKSGKKLKNKDYLKKLSKLHVELVKLQEWVKAEGLKVCIVFEGRDGAGKGGVIKAITERVSPRVFRVVALPAPTEREKTQMYGQRYIRHLPAGGEVAIFDRSWYNRAGVERIMGFCTEEEARHFLEVAPTFEKMMVDSGIILIKYWLEVSQEEQTRRLEDRIDDGRRYGNSPLRTSSPTTAGTITPGPAMKCFRRPTRRGRRGTWQDRTTRGARVLTSLPTFSVGSRIRRWSMTR